MAGQHGTVRVPTWRPVIRRELPGAGVRPSDSGEAVGHHVTERTSMLSAVVPVSFSASGQYRSLQDASLVSDGPMQSVRRLHRVTLTVQAFTTGVRPLRTRRPRASVSAVSANASHGVLADSFKAGDLVAIANGEWQAKESRRTTVRRCQRGPPPVPRIGRPDGGLDTPRLRLPCRYRDRGGAARVELAWGHQAAVRDRPGRLVILGVVRPAGCRCHRRHAIGAVT